MMKKFLLSIMSIAVATTCSFTANAISVWDGSTDTDWAQDANGNYLITSAAELAGLASVVNGGTNYSGTTFLLTDDIDLNNINWNPIGHFDKVARSNITCASSRSFNGTFNGQYHTISNCNVHLDECWDDAEEGRVSAGVFGYISGATIQNLSVANSSFYVNANSFDAFAGAIVGFMNNGSIIENCMSIKNNIKVDAPWKWGIDYGVAYAGGIAGCTEGSDNKNNTVTGCTVAENTITANGKKRSHRNDTANNYRNHTSNTENKNTTFTNNTTTSIADINRATILYNNLGIGHKPFTPYYLDETTGIPTDKIYYALLGINYNGDEIKEWCIREDAVIIHNSEKMDFPYEGMTYALYPAGTLVEVEFYLEGFSGNWKNKGYEIKDITDEQNSSVQYSFTYRMEEDGIYNEEESKCGYVKGDPTWNAATDRFLRLQRYEVVMPTALTTLYYTTQVILPTSVENATAATRTYAANGMIVVEAASESDVVVADMAGRMVYNGKVKEGHTELKVENGFYIVNGSKVVVR